MSISAHREGPVQEGREREELIVCLFACRVSQLLSTVVSFDTDSIT
jgi:hypothetical protein